MIPANCRDAYDAGYKAFDGQSHFLESPYFNSTTTDGELLWRFWVDGHIEAIKARNKSDFNHNQEGATQ